MFNISFEKTTPQKQIKKLESVWEEEMSSENANVIVTPIYRVIPTEFEKISLIRGFKVFCEPMVIIYPDGMDLSYYKEIAKKYASGKRIIFKEYPIKYFESVYGYNELLLKESFYTDY